MNKSLHIISFDVPFPPNYGGAIDVFYKLKNLHKLGVEITLHCFEYGRGKHKELEQYCKKVYYYDRKISKRLFFHSLPFIVVSRASEELISNLCKDTSPILFEGLHSCFYVNDNRLKNRKKIVRTHNIEHEYYRQLAQVEKNIFKRFYFLNEAKKLENFEKILSHASSVIAISPNDYKHLQHSKFNIQHSEYIPAFHAFDEVDIISKTEKFCLFHGNLAVGENNEAALYLTKEVFIDSSTPLVIAGSKPSKELKQLVEKNRNVMLEADIPTEKINELIQKAQINILTTHQNTGIKLKLLAALFKGKHCLVNTTMVENTGLESLCHIANTTFELKKKIKELINTPFPEQEIEKRKKILDEFIPQRAAQKIVQLIF